MEKKSDQPTELLNYTEQEKKIILQQFAAARDYFSQNPNKIKFSRKNPLNPDWDGHSFIKFDTKILCISCKYDFMPPNTRTNKKQIGSGSFARVVLAVDENFKVYALRIEQSKSNTPLSKIEPYFETGITDINSIVTRINDFKDTKHYSATFLGKRITEDPQLKAITRLDNAIKLLLELESIHSNEIFHGDIKHENLIIIDDQLKFIDFPNIKQLEDNKLVGLAARTPMFFNENTAINNIYDNLKTTPQSKDLLFAIDRYTAWNMMTHQDKQNYFLQLDIENNNTYNILIDSKVLEFTDPIFQSPKFLAVYLITRKLGIIVTDQTKLLGNLSCLEQIAQLYSEKSLSLLILGEILASKNISYIFNNKINLDVNLKLVLNELKCALLAGLSSDKKQNDPKRAVEIPERLSEIRRISETNNLNENIIQEQKNAVYNILSRKQSLSPFKPTSLKAAQCHLDNADYLIEILSRNKTKNFVPLKK